ncbi:MAG: methyltransferase domain-containing protein [Flavobacteriales bacterium]|nr:methyltransferase domain-containing protein [Flavobacteriales bacterium]
MHVHNWFKTWFNSPYYHLLYRNRDEAEAERFIDRLTAYLDLPRGSRALDLACGKGRHSLHLRKNGFDVVGIDLAEDSIEEARTLECDGLEFFVHDMRSLYWTKHFDLVVNLFTSFGYFHSADDDQKTISTVADALKPQGIFILDFMNVEKVIANLVDYEERTIDGVQFEISRAVEDGTIVKRIHVIDGDPENSGQVVELDFEEQVDALKLQDFVAYFEAAGLELMETFGDYNLNRFDTQHSDRLILIAKKTAA